MDRHRASPAQAAGARVKPHRAQQDLAGTETADTFRLVAERTTDGERVIREREQAAEAERERQRNQMELWER